ncbi:carbohydrate ABC transporter permease, partial [Fournierella sp.]|uniref:carbohydrate ABC transporter permease n=1 Tax=Allofournierella sp. TaxID=1940256 RepID=UPI0025B83A7C
MMKRTRGKERRPAALREARTGLMLAAPVFLGSGIFFLLPFLLMLRYSLTFGIGGTRFVGLRNYREVLESPAFQLAAKNTARFLVVGLPLIMALGLLVALLLRQKLPGACWLRRVLLLPMVLPIASIVMLVQILFADRGVLNGLLGQWGASPRQWLSGPESFWVLIGLYLWKNCGYNVVLFLAGLNMIPEELYQTAALDGAGAWAKFRFITLPLLVPSLFFGFIFSVVNSFK